MRRAVRGRALSLPSGARPGKADGARNAARAEEEKRAGLAAGAKQKGAGKTRMLDEHKHERKLARQQAPKTALRPEEIALSASSPAMAEMVDALKKRHAGRAVRVLQRLRRMWLDYPEEPLEQALTIALAHGLFDLSRIESLVLRHVAGDFFRLPIIHDEEPDDHE